jgi:hypothetical protein
LKPGRRPLTGSGDIMEIEFESAPDVNPGDSSYLDFVDESMSDSTTTEPIAADLCGDPTCEEAGDRVTAEDRERDGAHSSSSWATWTVTAS